MRQLIHAIIIILPKKRLTRKTVNTRGVLPALIVMESQRQALQPFIFGLYIGLISHDYDTQHPLRFFGPGADTFWKSLISLNSRSQSPRYLVVLSLQRGAKTNQSGYIQTHQCPTFCYRSDVSHYYGLPLFTLSMAMILVLQHPT